MFMDALHCTGLQSMVRYHYFIFLNHYNSSICTFSLGKVAYSVAELLIKNNASLTITDNYGDTPLGWARASGK